jgi:protein-serine/threonine kinase
LQEVILKCLEVKPERRWQSAAQLALALQDPTQVPLTARAERMQRSGLLKRFKRWFFAAGAEPRAAPQLGVASQVARSPIIMAAVDVDNATPELLDQLRETVRRIVLTEPGARLACVSVMKTARIGPDERVDEAGQSLHVKQLVGLRHWARPISKQLNLDDGRLTFHVLEAPDAAAAIVDFAERNQADHIVMGARGTSAMRRYLGSVSSQVVAQSDCTVTVVRT